MSVPRKVSQLCPELEGLLRAALAAGNTVRETAHAPGSDGTLVLLAHAFRAPNSALTPDIYLVAINDPHWWKSEYRCRLHPDVLACPFD